jgi:hypothetical protein
MSGPLDHNNGNAEVESDVIFTAVILGFSLTRVVQAQPFSFDMELTPGPNAAVSLDQLNYVVRGIRAILRRSGIRADANLISGIAPQHQNNTSDLITGRTGGQHLTPDDRNRPMTDQSALNMGAWERQSSQPHAVCYQGQYHGRGAYTGMIDDPIGHHTLTQPTIREVINDPNRWNPTGAGVWGLIGTNNLGGEWGPNLNNHPSQGMGPLAQHNGVVQYVHGMSWAMREAVRWGPWCNAYEMAVGVQTTKLASCFPCTTYMYAAGFPPSSCHIGRGESWGILPDGSLGVGCNHTFSAGAEGQAERNIASSINIRWHSQIFHYLQQGARLLRRHRVAMDNPHRQAALALDRHIENLGVAGLRNGGNLFLDAITFHKNDTQRLMDTFG